MIQCREIDIPRSDDVVILVDFEWQLSNIEPFIVENLDSARYNKSYNALLIRYNIFEMKCSISHLLYRVSPLPW